MYIAHDIPGYITRYAEHNGKSLDLTTRGLMDIGGDQFIPTGLWQDHRGIFHLSIGHDDVFVPCPRHRCDPILERHYYRGVLFFEIAHRLPLKVTLTPKMLVLGMLNVQMMAYFRKPVFIGCDSEGAPISIEIGHVTGGQVGSLLTLDVAHDDPEIKAKITAAIEADSFYQGEGPADSNLIVFR